jgi:hypothetical protein
MVVALAFATSGFSAVTVETSDAGAVVKFDGELFTEYLIKSGNKPVLWPIVAPGGKRVTRGFPIEPQPGETTDHVHQRGLWFTHGDVNGVILWSQEEGSGEIRHREFTKTEGGSSGTIATRNEYLSHDGNKICEDERVFRFFTDDDAHIIDAQITIRATEGELKFGDTEEGSFGVRLADSMRHDARPSGTIISSAGATGKKAWGQPAAWVDYYGPVDGETLGVAILDHPSNLGYPVRWHVRTYGLFAANPFTQHRFDPSLAPAATIVSKDKSMTLRYRVVVHRGDEKVGRIANRWNKFAKE